MGVPKFYRWISERYPCLSEVVREHEIPEFDNLYLDMNGIIHVCSHPEDDNPHFRMTQEKMFADIFHYIEVLFRLIKPKKVFFMAVDGVAPRAKMNQQRGRRFRSAKEAEKLEKKALDKGETLPAEARFDSNCITPGTEFMVKLQEQLKYFVVKKITTDKMWQGPRIYLSGHETPGEGEHKVMDFIRYEKSRPDYDHNTKHCLYGLDADLMMLGLSSHEPHFALLREEVRFGGKDSQKRSATVEETTFHLLHLTLFREYLDYEFSSLKNKLPFPYDLERIIDDWVLMGFLVGNDFIPHLPHLHIHMDALPLLWKTYKSVLPTLDGYLHDGGTLNLPRFEQFFKELAKYDFKVFVEQFDDLQFLEGKQAEGGHSRKGKHSKKAAKELANISRKRERASISSIEAGIPTANEFMTLADEDDSDDDLQKALGVMPLERWDEGIDGVPDEEPGEDLNEFMVEGMEDEESQELLREFRRHKNAYYCDKMKYHVATDVVLQEQSHGYVRALQWILHYYFNGCPSWSWFYPHHYAPYLSDVRSFSHLDIKFDLNTPFMPFQQLMAVLPSASKCLLPESLQQLMVNQCSPIFEFYPAEFEQDLNGKQQDWEAVVLIPFIEENRLLEAMRPQEALMTAGEKGRNSHGPHTLFQFSEDTQGTFISNLPEAFPDITNHRAKITPVDQDLFRVDPSKLYKGLCKGVSLDTYFPGFPTMTHLEHSFYLDKAGVKVFQMNSRHENTILKLKKANDTPEVEDVAKDLVGRSVYAGWPHMTEVRVVAVSDGCSKYSIVEAPLKHKGAAPKHEKIDIKVEEMSQDQSSVWYRETDSIMTKYHDRRGVDIGETDIILYALPMTGRRYVCGREGKVSVEKQWSCTPIAYAYQACAKDIKVKEPEVKQYSEISELFPENSDVFMLGQPHYGCQGQVLEVSKKNEGRIRVNFIHPTEPNLKHVISRGKRAQQYNKAYHIAQRLGISSHLVSRITGTMFVAPGQKTDALKNSNQRGRTNVGFNLKFNKTNKEVPGFTKKDPEDNQWLYSQRLLDHLREYIEEFPRLIHYLATHVNEDNFLADDIFGEGQGESKLKEIKEYLKGSPFAKIEPAEHGTEMLDDFIMGLIEEEVEKVKDSKKKRIKMQVKPHLVFRPSDAGNHVVPDPTSTYELFDRVVNVRDGYSVPLGLLGTVVGIRAAQKEQNILYEVLFDEEFLGGLKMRCSGAKVYRLPPSALINLCHGDRKEQALGHQKPTAVVKPQYGAANMDNSPRQHRTVDGQNPTWNRNRQNMDLKFNQQGYHQPQQSGGKQSYTNLQQHPVQPQVFYNQSGGHQHRPNRPQGHAAPQVPYGQFASSQRHRGPVQQPPQQPPQDNSDFLNMWNQLQKPNEVPETWVETEYQSSGQKQGRQEPHPSLNIAAQALNQSNVHLGPQGSQWMANQNRTHKQETTIPGSPAQQQPQGQKIDLNTLFRSAKQEPPASDISDFSRLMSGLAINDSAVDPQPDTSQEGTQTLQQLLKIGQGQEQSATNVKPLMDVDVSQPPPYNRHVSVHELMQGEVETRDQQKGTHLNKSKQHRGYNQGHANEDAMGMLLQYCSTNGLPTPRYNYQPGRESKIVATVHIGSDSVFEGAYTREKQHAAESAARVALFNMGNVWVRSAQPQSMQDVGLAGVGMSGTSASFSPTKMSKQQREEDLDDNARFAPSPNSAFTPVKGKTGYQGGNQHSDRRHNRHSSHGQPFPNPPFRSGTTPQQAFPHTHHHGQGYPLQGQVLPEFRGQGHHGQHPSDHRGYHKGQHHSVPMDYQNQGAYSDLKRSHEFTQQWKGGRHAEESTSFEEAAKHEDRSKSGVKEQFVPLQVMKKQHTPRKEDSQDSGAAEDTETDLKASQQQPASRHEHPSQSNRGTTSDKSQNKSEKKSGKSDKKSKGGPKASGSASKLVKDAKREGQEKSTQQHRRPKSRIAAKFSGLDGSS